MLTPEFSGDEFPAVIVEIKTFACELPRGLGHHYPRLSLSDLRHEAIKRGIVTRVGGTTHFLKLRNCFWVFRNVIKNAPGICVEVYPSRLKKVVQYII